MAHFQIPLNLPHAGTVADRITKHLAGNESVRRRTREAASSLAARLLIYRLTEENPAPEEAEAVRQEALEMARQVVELIEANGVGTDRLGQCVRNLFECLAEGAEGADRGLQAGENPDSLQRPV